MPIEPSTEVTFVAGEARADVFAGIGLFCGGLLLLLGAESSNAGWFIIAFGCYVLWRGVCFWRKPYVLLSVDRLVIFNRGQPKHYVPFDTIAAVQRSFNRTLLLMRDGLKIHVSHLGFASRAEVEHFRAELLRRLQVTMI